MGWRHFQVKERQQGEGGLVFAELRAVCDPQVRIWVNASTLKNRALWQAGWTPLEDGIPCGSEDNDTSRVGGTESPPLENTSTKEPESCADWAGI